MKIVYTYKVDIKKMLTFKTQNIDHNGQLS